MFTLRLVKERNNSEARSRQTFLSVNSSGELDDPSKIRRAFVRLVCQEEGKPLPKSGVPDEANEYYLDVLDTSGRTLHTYQEF